MKLNYRTATCACLAGLVTAAFAQQRTFVYAMNNDAAVNRVFFYEFFPDGTMVGWEKFPTGGRGTGINETPLSGPNDGVDPLGSQGSLTLSHNGQYLFACNAGSNSISVFRILNNGRLELRDVEPSRGMYPVSVTGHGDLVYVANVNDPQNGVLSEVVGFRRSGNGQLTHISAVDMPVNGRPSQVGFTPGGGGLVVTLRGTNTINTWTVGEAGSLSDLRVTQSARPNPFGFAFARNDVMVVAEPSMDFPTGSSASSYDVGPGRAGTPISEAVPNGEFGSSRLTMSPDRRRAYVSNIASNTLSTYGISDDGELTLRQASVSFPFNAPGAPIDAGITRNGDWLFQLLGARGDFAFFSTDSNRDLVYAGFFHAELPMLGSQGLAVSP